MDRTSFGDQLNSWVDSGMPVKDILANLEKALNEDVTAKEIQDWKDKAMSPIVSYFSGTSKAPTPAQLAKFCAAALGDSHPNWKLTDYEHFTQNATDYLTTTEKLTGASDQEKRKILEKELDDLWDMMVPDLAKKAKEAREKAEKKQEEKRSNSGFDDLANWVKEMFG